MGKLKDATNKLGSAMDSTIKEVKECGEAADDLKKVRKKELDIYTELGECYDAKTKTFDSPKIVQLNKQAEDAWKVTLAKQKDLAAVAKKVKSGLTVISAAITNVQAILDNRSFIASIKDKIDDTKIKKAQKSVDDACKTIVDAQNFMKSHKMWD